MKHRSIRELFDYWSQRRGCRPAPERAEIEPGAIRHALADIFILSHQPQGGHPFRIAGTRVCALFGRELKGQAFLELWSRQARAEIAALVAVVTQESVGVLAGASAEHAGEAPLGLELLLLPLTCHGRADARLIGALAPRATPHWLGARALGPLILGTHRYVGHASELSSTVPARTPPASDRVRHSLIVYDGGRS
jgi:hypothetical protein